jgi:hypothetical protein
VGDFATTSLRLEPARGPQRPANEVDKTCGPNRNLSPTIFSLKNLKTRHRDERCRPGTRTNPIIGVRCYCWLRCKSETRSIVSQNLQAIRSNLSVRYTRGCKKENCGLRNRCGAITGNGNSKERSVAHGSWTRELVMMESYFQIGPEPADEIFLQ